MNRGIGEPGSRGQEAGGPNPALEESRTLPLGLTSQLFLHQRLDLRWGRVGDITVIGNFVHHPTAVRETIGAVRSGYPGQRLWAVFEPGSNTSRRRVFQREFSLALGDADRVVVAGVYQPKRVPEGERLSPTAIVDEINRVHQDHRAVFIERASEIMIPSAAKPSRARFFFTASPSAS